MKNISYFIQYIFLRGVARLLAFLPEVVLYGLARFLGGFVFSVLRLRRQVSLTNLKQALGEDKSENQLRKIARRAYGHIAITFLEMLLVPHRGRTFIDRLDISDMAPLQQGQGRGIVAITGHFGSWELAGAAVVASGLPCTVVAARQSNPYIDAFFNRSRKLLGMKVVPLTNASVKTLLQCIRQREAIGLVADQNAGSRGIFVDFFGRPASTYRGAAQLALKYGVPMVAVFALRTTAGHYRCICKEIPIVKGDSVVALTQRFTGVIEEIVRQYPEQYMWMHRRWKTRPKKESK